MPRANRDRNLRLLRAAAHACVMLEYGAYHSCDEILTKVPVRGRVSKASLGRVLASSMLGQEQYIVMRQRRRDNVWIWYVEEVELAPTEVISEWQEFRASLSPAGVRDNVPKPGSENQETAKIERNRFTNILAGVEGT